MVNSEQASSLLAHPSPDFSFLPTTTMLVHSKTGLCIESHIRRLYVLLTASSQIQGAANRELSYIRLLPLDSAPQKGLPEALLSPPFLLQSSCQLLDDAICLLVSYGHSECPLVFGLNSFIIVPATDPSFWTCEVCFSTALKGGLWAREMVQQFKGMGCSCRRSKSGSQHSCQAAPKRLDPPTPRGLILLASMALSFMCT